MKLKIINWYPQTLNPQTVGVVASLDEESPINVALVKLFAWPIEVVSKDSDLVKVLKDMLTDTTNYLLEVLEQKNIEKSIYSTKVPEDVAGVISSIRPLLWVKTNKIWLAFDRKDDSDYELIYVPVQSLTDFHIYGIVTHSRRVGDRLEEIYYVTSK